MRKPPWIAALLLSSIFAPAAHAGAIYAFGDSLSDVGNVYIYTGGVTPAAPYVNGQFTNGNVWVQDLASLLGAGPLTPSLAGGTDYAYGGAETGVTPFNTSLAASDLVGATGQIAQFYATHAFADPNALYTIWIGGNDLIDILKSGPPTQAAAASDANMSVANIDAAINELAAGGAKNFLLLTMPQFVLNAPEVVAAGLQTQGSVLGTYFNSTLVNGAGAIPSLSTLAIDDSVHISVLSDFISNPFADGFTNVNSPCYTGTYEGFANAADPGTVCPNPNQYLFWDGLHPTAAADAVIADAAFATVAAPEPSSMLLLATGLLCLLACSTWIGKAKTIGDLERKQPGCSDKVH